MKNKEKIALLLERVERLERSVFNVFDTKEESIDKFAELKEAHRNGAVIQCKQIGGDWYEPIEIAWDKNREYRIKPEEKPKVGDLVKAWNNQYGFVVGTVRDTETFQKRIGYILNGSSTEVYCNAKTITKEETIKLLFGDGSTD